jgi:hypothetical protein
MSAAYGSSTAKRRTNAELAAIGALIAEVVDVLARAMLGEPASREGNVA